MLDTCDDVPADLALEMAAQTPHVLAHTDASDENEVEGPDLLHFPGFFLVPRSLCDFV